MMMIHTKKINFLLFVILLSSGILSAQQWESPCGTPDVRAETFKEWHENRPHIASSRSNDPLFVKMKVHIVGDDNGEGYYPLADLLRSYCKLNQDMATAGIIMELDPDINYIASSIYNTHDFPTGAQMMSQYNESGMVNCYIVADPAGNCGYYSPSTDGVALSKNCLGPVAATWAHELGHFFSLPHTFSGWEGITYEYGEQAPDRVGNRNRLVEYADSSNCNVSGDGLCDTKADYLSFRWGCAGGLSPGDLVDPTSAVFRAEGANIMSYSRGNCPVIFSEEQIDAMNFDITRGRLNHISQNEIPDPINFDPETFEPVDGFDEEPLQFDDATIRWESIEGADEYIVELTQVKFISTPPDFEFRTTDTMLKLDFLELDVYYDWEVYPFHNADGCSPGSGKNRFLATQLSSNESPINQYTLTLYPIPVRTGTQIQVSFFSKNGGEMDWELLDAQGKIITGAQVNNRPGNNNFDILAPVHSGLYFLRLITAGESTTKKVIVN